MNPPHTPEHPAPPAREDPAFPVRAGEFAAPGVLASKAVGTLAENGQEVRLAVAQALLDSDAALQGIAAHVNQMSGSRDEIVRQAMLLVTAHLIGNPASLYSMAAPVSTPVAQEFAGPLAELAGDVKRIANQLDPPPGDVVDTARTATRPGPMGKEASRRARRFGSRWYSIEEAASASGRSVSTIRRDIRAGTLPAHVVGRGRRRPSYRIRRADLNAYIQSGRAEPPDPPPVPTTPVRKKSRHFD